MKNLVNFVALVVIVSILGCARHSIRERYSPGYDYSKIKVAAVLPFPEIYTDQFTPSLRSGTKRQNNEDSLSGTLKSLDASVRNSLEYEPKPVMNRFIKNPPYYNMNAKDTLYYEPINIISKDLAATGLTVLSGVKICEILNAEQIDIKERLEKTKYIELGKLYDIDIIVTGNIVLQKAVGKRTGTIDVRVIETSTGNIIYSASGSKKDPWAAQSIDGFRKDMTIAISKQLAKYFKK